MELERLITTQKNLISRIQSGNNSLYPELWETVMRFVMSRANRYYNALKDSYPLIDLDELISAGYLAMYPAVKSFDISAGKSFAAWLFYYCKKEWRKLYGIDSKALNAVSLDAPVSNSEDDITLADTIPDNDSISPEEAAESADSKLWLKSAMNELLSGLPRDSESIIRASYILNKSVKTLSEETGLEPLTVSRIKSKGLQQLRSMTRRTPLGRKIREFYFDSVTFHRVGLNEFRRTHVSEQEKYVMNLERAERRALKQMPLDDLEPDEVIALAGYRAKNYSPLYFYVNRH